MIREGFAKEGDTIHCIFSKYNLQVGEELQTLPLVMNWIKCFSFLISGYLNQHLGGKHHYQHLINEQSEASK